MDNKIYRWALFFAFSVLLFWSCSSGPKPEKVPPPPPPQQAPAEIQKPPAATIETEKPVAQKTIIPAEEKKATDEQAAQQEKNAISDKDDAASLLDEALLTYQEAKLARERGDLDAALKELDKAYGIILRVNLPPDSPLNQDKNNLRLLIAQRIQEISASSRNPINGNHKSIPLVENKYVLREIESFRTRERKEFETAYLRSGLYREMIVEELKKAGLPEELSWLPVIESWYMVRALSRSRALGLWQFLATTGYRYGLIRDKFIDERMDPYKATQAAVKYLTELHSFFGEWTTALAAYNCGEIRVQNVINTQRINYMDNFWDLFERLPYETSRFVPRFVAAVLIINDPEKYGFNLPTPYSPLRFETVVFNHPTKLATISAALGLESSELEYLNPELRYGSTPDREYQLRVPVGYAEKALQAVNNLPKFMPPEYAVHTVRPGETLSVIARKYGTSVQAIARLNGLQYPYLLKVGIRLRIPGRG
jgi:membrane-bound lytic murein transglycosylase D